MSPKIGEKRQKLVASVVIVLVVASVVLIVGTNYDLGDFLNLLMGLDEPILIESDQDFEDQGWPGRGIGSDPYVISGKTICPEDGKPCIEISNTTVFFTVRNCNLVSTSGEAAIRLVNLRYASIQSCNIRSKSRGIEAFSVSSSSFMDNLISGYVNASSEVMEIVSQEGIYGVGGERNEFSGNTFSHIFLEALHLRSMENCIISDNMMSNTKEGMYLSDGIFLRITGNEILNSGYGGSSVSENNGIEIYGCGELTIVDNILHDNAGYGIQITQSFDSIISDNFVFNNTLGGIYIDSHGITVMTCTVASNGGDGVIVIGNNCVIEDSHIHHNSESGIYFNRIETGTARYNRIEFNSAWGICVIDCITLFETDNLFDSNTLGDVGP